MPKDIKQVTISVSGVPPVKTTQQRHKNKIYKKKLADKCLSIALKNKKKHALTLYEKPVKLSIFYSRFGGTADSCNIIGGIADTLKGYFYRDDKQITEIYYRERSTKKKDEYEIILEAS